MAPPRPRPRANSILAKLKKERKRSQELESENEILLQKLLNLDTVKMEMMMKITQLEAELKSAKKALAATTSSKKDGDSVIL
jgi:hypothetical protein